MRGDLIEQSFRCIRARRCRNKIFVINDLTLQPQVAHFLCKRSYETDTVRGCEPRCGDMPPIPNAHAPEPGR